MISLPLKMPSVAPISGGLQGRTKSVQSATMSCPFQRQRSIVQLRVGCHSLPNEHGRIGKPMLRHLHGCICWTVNAVGDERHCGFDCPLYRDFSATACIAFPAFSGATRCLRGHRDQTSVCVGHRQTGPDIMTDLSSLAFASCLDVVNLSLL